MYFVETIQTFIYIFYFHGVTPFAEFLFNNRDWVSNLTRMSAFSSMPLMLLRIISYEHFVNTTYLFLGCY